MKKFILKLLFILVAIYILLISVQSTLDFYLSKDNVCKNNSWSQIYSGELQTDIAILGTSRAEVHYDPQIISSNTGLTTYNLGLSGTPYNILRIRWNSYRNINKLPKIIILDVDDTSLLSSKKLFNKFQYLPYSKSIQYQNVASTIDSDFLLEKHLPLYKYRGYEMEIYKQLRALKNTKFCSAALKGYISHDINWIEKDFKSFQKLILTDTINGENLDSIYQEGKTNLSQIISDSKKQNISVFIFWSPLYFESLQYRKKHKLYIDSYLKNLAKKNDIIYVNFSNDSIGQYKANFYNSSHMNKQGSQLYSNKIALILKNYLKK